VFDIIDNGVNGIIVPICKKKFIIVLKNIMASDERRENIAKAAMKSVMRFHVDKIVDLWEKLIDNIRIS